MNTTLSNVIKFLAVTTVSYWAAMALIVSVSLAAISGRHASLEAVAASSIAGMCAITAVYTYAVMWFRTER